MEQLFTCEYSSIILNDPDGPIPFAEMSEEMEDEEALEGARLTALALNLLAIVGQEEAIRIIVASGRFNGSSN